MRALVIEKPHRAVVKEVPDPVAGAGEVVIRVERVGVCGTDFHIYEGEFLSPYPIIPGHEFSGTIHELGEGVEGLHVGDRVTADPSLFCGRCVYCLTNRGNQCEDWGALGNTADGSMAEYVKVPVRNVVRIPDAMSMATAAFIEPMACVVHAMNRLQLQAGHSVLLFGAGAMGLQLVQSLTRLGASRLTVVDVSDRKLELARTLGATEAVNARNKTALNGRKFDVVVDATGIPAVIEEAMTYLGKTAKYLQFGVTPKDAQIRVNPFDIYHRDWTILGSMAINHTFLPAFEWVKEGRVQLEPLVSKVIALEETPDFLAKPKDPELLKVQIRIG
ncbi:zinc-dependent alcohol dehydrogenase family protein [Cohnella thailandensis]|uniref:Zinc-dependent alcohol dehydrogenase family protein n=1 Tax=Cohnella thailandensis TaxID=557557 RepID=A0A841T1I2_9BACL|nr:zinc-dependent alcohol dehydrogenase family protein [Cohnella thailandensis]MBB6636909.1 zinc-dependent alcohol dehydrogenase family protein [Cohnella thailandensis]MBP1973210.1 2-desacetyl-2-hydroxyethyl bacteriochlorophyllide A dehydrogenase [Cohnella thailandensis]